MPGRLRQGTGVSDKAQNCCNKFCEYCCRLSRWNQVLCYSFLALVIVSVILMVGGSFAMNVGEGDIDSENLCSGPAILFGGDNGDRVDSEGVTEAPIEPDVQIQLPLSGQSRNAYAWWLTNAGIFCIIMMVMSCLCCFSYVALCCSFRCHLAVKILAVVGFILLIIGLMLFIAMLGFGSYLVGQFGGRATFNQTCRSMLAYLLLMYLYLVVFIGSCFGVSVWALCGGRDADNPNKKGRESAKSDLKLPPTKVLTAMV